MGFSLIDPSKQFGEQENSNYGRYLICPKKLPSVSCTNVIYVDI